MPTAPRLRPALLLLVLLWAGLGTGSASAAVARPTVAEITRPLRTQVAYVGPNVRPRVSPVALRRAAARHPGFRYVVLQQLPRGVASGQALADALLAAVRRPNTTIAVVVNRRLWAASSRFPATRTQTAVRRARRGTDKRPIPTLERFASYALNPAPPAAPKPKKDEGGGFPWRWVLVVGLVALAALGALRLRARSHDARARRRGGVLATARDFHAQRLDSLSARHGNLVREVADRPDDADLAEHFELARGKIAALRRSLPALVSPRELRTFAGELDEVEWHVQCCQAAVAGTEPPEKPLRDRPGLCFFTHELGLATHAIEVDRPDGTRTTVRVCGPNYEALMRGELPAVSQVHVGARLVPWPAAPTWYGAAGWSAADLPGLEYEGREIWGRDLPQRVVPLEPSADPTRSDPGDDGASVTTPDDAPAPADPVEPGSGSAAAPPSTPSETETSLDAPAVAPPAVEAGEATGGGPAEGAGSPGGGAPRTGQPGHEVWDELDRPAPPGLSRRAASEAIGPLVDTEVPPPWLTPDERAEREPRRRGGEPGADGPEAPRPGARAGEPTVAFDPFAEDADPFVEPDARRRPDPGDG